MHDRPRRRRHRRIEISQQIRDGCIRCGINRRNRHGRLNRIADLVNLNDNCRVLGQHTIGAFGPATQNQFIDITRRKDRNIAGRIEVDLTILALRRDLC